ncbi:hypothetical protein [Sphingomonas hankookensis]|uniref:hypothetical protein n=1 Tax=Sphingomonas hankookensis TaxID=563996 RepID=UPI003D3033F8
MTDPRVKTAQGPTILLGSGHYFDLLDPDNSRFTLADIARGLGNACRFAGQCDRFYSVAEHTWLASFLVPPPLAFAALMHDAPEAFIGDVTRPLKSLLPTYKEIEQMIAAVIADRFLLGGQCEHALVKRADLQLLAAEQQAMMPAHDDTWHCLAGIDVPAIEFKHWSPADAAKNWLLRAETLIGRFPGADVESLLS